MDSSAASSQGQNVKRGVVSKCAHGISDGNQDFIRDWMTSHSQAKNLPTFCPQPETSGGKLSLKVLDKLEGKKKAAKQPSFQNRPFIFLFFIIL